MARAATKGKTIGKTKGKTGGGGWIDVSVPMRPGMPHWPGDCPFSMVRTLSTERDDLCNLSQLAMSAHMGTHMDAPLHFVHRGAAMESLPLDAVVGKARVIAIRDRAVVTADELRPHRLRAGERVLFKTANSAKRWRTDDFAKDFIHIRLDAAELLVERGVRTVGIDYLSVGGYKSDGVEVHRTLLGAGIWLIEGLDLSKAKPGPVDLVCLPLRIVGAEGAPARVILRARSRG